MTREENVERINIAIKTLESWRDGILKGTHNALVYYEKDFLTNDILEVGYISGEKTN